VPEVSKAAAESKSRVADREDALHGLVRSHSGNHRVDGEGSGRGDHGEEEHQKEERGMSRAHQPNTLPTDGFDKTRSSGSRRSRQRWAIVTRRFAVREQRGHVVVARTVHRHIIATATATAGRRICRYITVAGGEAVLFGGEGLEGRVSEVV
jgi:ribosomal protein L15